MTNLAQILFVCKNHITGFVLVSRRYSTVPGRDQPQDSMPVYRHSLRVTRILQHRRDPPAGREGAHHAAGLGNDTRHVIRTDATDMRAASS